MALTADSAAAPPGATSAGTDPASRTAQDDPASLQVVPARHYARWAAAVAVIVLVAQFAHGLATNPVWEWSVFRDYFLSETIVQAVWVTLQLTAYATVLGFLLGTVLAFMRLSRSPVLRTVAWSYIW
ncbi:amino acid ABC transporter permease, partial [Streptomyces hydrogenans]